MPKQDADQQINCFFDSAKQAAEFEFPAASEEIKAKRILFMGSPDFALPQLKALVEQGYNVVAVATQPDRKVGRKQVLTPTPVKVLAQELDLPVYDWVSLKNTEALEDLTQIKPDLIITSAYGNILPPKVLDFPPYGCINIHPSDLPRWRGASPIESALLAGDERVAASIMLMGEGLDDGDVLAKCYLAVNQEIDAPALSTELADLSAALLIKILPAWYLGLLSREEQDESKVTYAPKLSREDGLLDWRKTAQENHDKVRALRPWPEAYTIYQGQRYKVRKSSIIEEGTNAMPGEVVRRGKNLIVSCHDKLLCLEEIQSPKGKIMSGYDCYHNFAEGSFFD